MNDSKPLDGKYNKSKQQKNKQGQNIQFLEK